MSEHLYRIGLVETEVSEDQLQKLGFPFRLVSPREQIIASAKSVLGKPYKWGASVLKDAPDFFDCSAFISWVAVEAGLAIPRMVIDQYVYADKLQKDDMKPGDLVFSNSGRVAHVGGSHFSQVLGREIQEEPIRTETVEFKPGTKVPEGVDHVGIYLGDGKIIHSSSDGVVEEILDTSAIFQNIVGYRRIIPTIEGKRFVITIPTDRLDLRNKDLILKEISKYN